MDDEGREENMMEGERKKGLKRMEDEIRGGNVKGGKRKI